MEGWAAAFAAWGVTVAVPALCHSSFTDADHEANGRDLVSLVSVLGMGDAVYMGHSAGGLAALVAASGDPSAVAVIGLDMTDADGIGAAAAAGVRVPVYGLVGEPSACNSDNNGMASYASITTATALRVTDSDHCDFENETDWMCSWFCPAGGGSFSDAEIGSTVGALSIAALMEALGLEAQPGAWWAAGGEYYGELLASGAIAPL
jgi:pimeloyl-ACP methyl ester carboxylesterase